MYNTEPQTSNVCLDTEILDICLLMMSDFTAADKAHR